MIHVLKKYGPEIHHYYSETDIYTLKMQMREKFADLSKWRTVSINLRGKFILPNQFEIKPKWQLGYSKNLGRPSLHIEGELIANGKRTEVVIKVVPFPFIPPLIGSIICGITGIYHFFEDWEPVGLIVGLALVFLVPFIILRATLNEKRELRDNFARAFHLHYVKTY